MVHIRGVTRPNMTQQVGRAQHGPTYNGPIYLYRLSILSGRAQQTFSMAYALLGPPVDTSLVHINYNICNLYSLQDSECRSSLLLPLGNQRTYDKILGWPGKRPKRHLKTILQQYHEAIIIYDATKFMKSYDVT